MCYRKVVNVKIKINNSLIYVKQTEVMLGSFNTFKSIATPSLDKAEDAACINEFLESYAV